MIALTAAVCQSSMDPANAALRCRALKLAETAWIAVQVAFGHFRKTKVGFFCQTTELQSFPSLGWRQDQRCLPTCHP